MPALMLTLPPHLVLCYTTPIRTQQASLELKYGTVLSTVSNALKYGEKAETKKRSRSTRSSVRLLGLSAPVGELLFFPRPETAITITYRRVQATNNNTNRNVRTLPSPITAVALSGCMVQGIKTRSTDLPRRLTLQLPTTNGRTFGRRKVLPTQPDGKVVHWLHNHKLISRAANQAVYSCIGTLSPNENTSKGDSSRKFLQSYHCHGLQGSFY